MENSNILIKNANLTDHGQHILELSFDNDTEPNLVEAVLTGHYTNDLTLISDVRWFCLSYLIGLPFGLKIDNFSISLRNLSIFYWSFSNRSEALVPYMIIPKQKELFCMSILVFSPIFLLQWKIPLIFDVFGCWYPIFFYVKFFEGLSVV